MKQGIWIQKQNTRKSRCSFTKYNKWQGDLIMTLKQVVKNRAKSVQTKGKQIYNGTGKMFKCKHTVQEEVNIPKTQGNTGNGAECWTQSEYRRATNNQKTYIHKKGGVKHINTNTHAYIQKRAIHAEYILKGYYYIFSWHSMLNTESSADPLIRSQRQIECSLLNPTPMLSISIF